MTPRQPTPFVSARETLKAVFAPDVRPTEQWLRREVRAGRVRALRLGNRLVFDVEAVRSDLTRNFRNVSPS